MGLEHDRETYDDILRAVHANVARANVDVTVDFRRQDPAKLASVYKLTRGQFEYLTRARFPLDWAVAEMTKQFLRNKRRYGVKTKRIPDRESRKRAAEEGDPFILGSRKRHRATASIPHIDDRNEEEQESDQDEENESDG